MRNPCRIMMGIQLTIGLCIGDEIMSGLNYKTKIMILLGLAFIMLLFAGCGSSDKFYITENQYLNTDKIRVLAKGLDPYGNQGWGVAVNQVTIDPKDGSILEEGRLGFGILMSMMAENWLMEHIIGVLLNCKNIL